MLRQRSADARGTSEPARLQFLEGWKWAAVILAAAVLVSAGAAWGDKVIRKDGTETTGRIISQDGGKVVMQVSKYGADFQMEIPASDVKAVVMGGSDAKIPPKPPAAEAAATAPAAGLQEKRYYAIPIVGEIGTEVKADDFRIALADAVKAMPDFVVLYVDSGGGSVLETREILEIIAETEGLKLVAYVKQALSAAAIITLTCPDIYMSPSAVIGGAVPYMVGPDGTPKAIEEKFQSVIRAQFRAAAELGEHPSALVEAMMDPNAELFLVAKDGKKRLAAAGPGKLLKAKGKVLAMTAGEAIACGVAKGKARRLASVHKAMGLESWARVEGKGWDIMAGRASLAKRREMLEEQRKTVVAQRQNVNPEIKKVDDQLRGVAKNLRRARTEMSFMESEYAREVAAINATYEHERKRAKLLGMKQKAQERKDVLRRAGIAREKSFFNLRRKFDPRVRAMTLKVQGLLEQQKELSDKRRQLIKLGGK